MGNLPTLDMQLCQGYSIYMLFKLKIADLVMSQTRGLGMIIKLRPATVYITWFDDGEPTDYHRSIVLDFRNFYLEYRKYHKL